MQIKEILKIVLTIIICQLAGIIGSVFTFSSINYWYALLNESLLNIMHEPFNKKTLYFHWKNRIASR